MIDGKLRDILKSLFDLDQLTARIQGDLPLWSLFLQIPFEIQPHEGIEQPESYAHVCKFHPHIYCNVPYAVCSSIGCEFWLNKLE